jgi:hypothetical protein
MLGLAAASGMTCPPGGNVPGGNPNPPVPAGNYPPRILINSTSTPAGNNFAQQGDTVNIAFSGEDAEDQARARIFASVSPNPNSTTPTISILSNFSIGPGQGSGVALWDTTTVPVGTYNIFAEIDDGTFDPLTGQGNPPVRVTSANPVQVGPQGSQPPNTPPRFVFLDPLPNLGLSTQDEVTVRYIYSDTDTPVRVTLLLDKDNISTNDDVNNPGDPLDPASKIIILPNLPRNPTDPTFDGDPPPPDDPANPPTQPDSVEIRTNPRTLPATTPGMFPFPGAPMAGELKEYRFTIDFARIPVRSQPYFIRATITDGSTVVHRYAVGTLTIARLASGEVDLGEIGFSLAGARFHGFSAFENLGTSYNGLGDVDGDGVDDFVVVGRYASPRNRSQVGAAYQVFGRRKTPFPPDTNNNGLPDVIGPGGTPVDFPATPDYLPNAYDARNVGRFGGIVSVNSVAAFFRGTTHAMPVAHGLIFPPTELVDPDHQAARSAGLTSVTSIDLTGDGVRDVVFGLPFVSSARDHTDDDPAEGGCGSAYDVGCGFNGFFLEGSCYPNAPRCTRAQNDDLVFGIEEVPQGMVIATDGRADLRTTFLRSVDAGLAGQFDPGGATDDEGIGHGRPEIPDGFRIRGGWVDDTFPIGPIVSDNEFGATVASMPGIDGIGEDLLISSPGYGNDRGRVEVWIGGNYLDEIFYGQEAVRSLPVYTMCTNSCVTPPPQPPPAPMDPPFCVRCFLPTGPFPAHLEIFGEVDNDRLGRARAAGDVDQDGVPDVVAGAPGADRRAVFQGTPTGPQLTDNGIVYIVQLFSGGFGGGPISGFPRIEIVGSHDDDRFGQVQTGVQSIDGDSVEDIAFGAGFFDVPGVGVDAGYVGVVFGNRPFVGHEGFAPEEVGTAILPGVRFVGSVPGARAGHDVASAGDFNQDGFGDLLISCPGENRMFNGQLRLGTVYLVFGGPHLDPAVNGSSDNIFSLSEVGSAALPGIVFFGRAPVAPGDPDTDSALETVGGVGDVDGDGFDDIFIGAPQRDFVNPLSPNQRREDAGEVYLIYGSNAGTNQVPPSP